MSDMDDLAAAVVNVELMKAAGIPPAGDKVVGPEVGGGGGQIGQFGHLAGQLLARKSPKAGKPTVAAPGVARPQI
jgi:hypothetical protein